MQLAILAPARAAGPRGLSIEGARRCLQADTQTGCAAVSVLAQLVHGSLSPAHVLLHTSFGTPRGFTAKLNGLGSVRLRDKVSVVIAYSASASRSRQDTSCQQA